MRRIDIKRYREQAARTLALARAVRKNGDYDFAVQLVRQATHYLDMVALAESERLTRQRPRQLLGLTANATQDIVEHGLLLMALPERTSSRF